MGNNNNTNRVSSKNSELSKKFPLVMLTWKDAESDAQWGEKSEVEEWASKDCLVTDIGWVIHENKKCIVICSQINDGKTFGNRTKIPVGWIVSKRKVTLKCRK